MSEFLDIINHAKKLNSALKNVSITEVEILINKLEKIVEKRKLAEAKQQALAAEKAKNIEKLQQMMLECGISPQELTLVADKAPKKKREPRPAKYAIIINGEQITWTGQGRMPNVFKNSSAPIEDFLIKQPRK